MAIMCAHLICWESILAKNGTCTWIYIVYKCIHMRTECSITLLTKLSSCFRLLACFLACRYMPMEKFADDLLCFFLFELYISISYIFYHLIEPKAWYSTTSKGMRLVACHGNVAVATGKFSNSSKLCLPSGHDFFHSWTMHVIVQTAIFMIRWWRRRWCETKIFMGLDLLFLQFADSFLHLH